MDKVKALANKAMHSSSAAENPPAASTPGSGGPGLGPESGTTAETGMGTGVGSGGAESGIGGGRMGGQTGPGGVGGQDYVDKGVAQAEKSFGIQQNAAMNEKITDAGRGFYEKETGKTVNPKISN